MKFSGVIPPLCTPFADNGELDRESFRNLLDFQIDAGASAIFILGSSGEAIYLDDRVRLEVVDEARSHLKGRVPLIVGALAPSTLRVIQQISIIGDDVDAFVMTGPFYAQLSEVETREHFTSVAKKCRRPIIAYDIPGNTGKKLPNGVLESLLKTGVLSGLKDSSGDIDTFEQLLECVGLSRTASLLSGADTYATKALSLGADGLVPGLSNIRPRMFTSLINANKNGDIEKEAGIQKAITMLNRVFHVGMDFGLGRHSSEIGALKHILKSEGRIAHSASPIPLQQFPAVAGEKVLEIVNDADLLFTAAESKAALKGKEND